MPTESASVFLSGRDVRRTISKQVTPGKGGGAIVNALRDALTAAHWEALDPLPSYHRWVGVFPYQIVGDPPPDYVRPKFTLDPPANPTRPLFDYFLQPTAVFGWNALGLESEFVDDRWIDVEMTGCGTPWWSLGDWAGQSVLNHGSSFNCSGIFVLADYNPEPGDPVPYGYVLQPTMPGPDLDDTDLGRPIGSRAGTNWMTFPRNGGYVFRSADGRVTVQILHGGRITAPNATWPSFPNRIPGEDFSLDSLTVVVSTQDDDPVYYQLSLGADYTFVGGPNQFCLVAENVTAGNTFLLVSSLCTDPTVGGSPFAAPLPSSAVITLGERRYSGPDIGAGNNSGNADDQMIENMPQNYLGWNRGVATAIDGRAFTPSQVSNRPNPQWRYPTLVPFGAINTPLYSLRGRPLVSSAWVAATHIQEAGEYSRIVGALWDARCESAYAAPGSLRDDVNPRYKWLCVSGCQALDAVNSSLWMRYDSEL